MTEARRKVEIEDVYGGGKVIYLRSSKEKTERKACNLCQVKFTAHSKFERFCPDCKESSELYHFHEWLPAC